MTLALMSTAVTTTAYAVWERVCLPVLKILCCSSTWAGRANPPCVLSFSQTITIKFLERCTDGACVSSARLTIKSVYVQACEIQNVCVCVFQRPWEPSGEHTWVSPGQWRTHTWLPVPHTQTGLYWLILFRWLDQDGNRRNACVCVLVCVRIRDYLGGSGGSWWWEITTFRVL